LIVLGVITVLMFSSVGIAAVTRPTAAVTPALGDYHIGYVDRIISEVIEGADQEALALLDGDIDAIGEQMDPAYVNQLLADPNVKMFQTDRLGYGIITIPTWIYPWNVTQFRRATAYAFDKEEGVQNLWSGYALPQDCVIPSSQPQWTFEHNLTETYYAQDVAKAIEVLVAAGFQNDSTPATYQGTAHDWWFAGLDGSPLEVEIWSALSSESTIASGYADLIAEGLRAAHIKAYDTEVSFNTYLAMYANHTITAPVFLGWGLSADPDWLYWDFHSDNLATDWLNPAAFSNATVDAYLEELIVSSNLTRIEELTDLIQEAIWYESPVILCYMNKILSFVRDDDYTGHVVDTGIGAHRYWGRMTVRPIPFGAEDLDGDGFGGTYRVNLPTDVPHRNPLTSSSGYHQDIMDCVFETLMRTDPYTGEDILGLAWNWSLTLDEATNTTKLTFDIFENATWHDGTPVTAEDVNFTMYYLRDMGGHIFTSAYPDVINVTITDTYSVEVIANTTSYFTLHNVGSGSYIIPKHIWETKTNTSALTSYDPEWAIGCGPYNYTVWVPGEYVQLDFYEDYYYAPPGRGAVAPPVGVDPLLAVAAVAVVAVVVLVAGYFIGKRGK
jgi:ABC-type transport system substrate-binding protein